MQYHAVSGVKTLALSSLTSNFEIAQPQSGPMWLPNSFRYKVFSEMRGQSNVFRVQQQCKAGPKHARKLHTPKKDPKTAIFGQQTSGVGSAQMLPKMACGVR